MLNPYILLGLTLFWLASVTGAYFKGSEAAQNEARAKYATDLESAIKQHNENAVIDMQAAAKVAADEAAARTRIAILRNRTTEVIHAKPLPVSCNLDSDRFRLLTAAIQEANGDSKDAAGRVRNAADKVNRAIR